MFIHLSKLFFYCIYLFMYINWLIDRSIDYLIDWFTDWLMFLLVHFFIWLSIYLYIYLIIYLFLPLYVGEFRVHNRASWAALMDRILVQVSETVSGLHKLHIRRSMEVLSNCPLPFWYIYTIESTIRDVIGKNRKKRYSFKRCNFTHVAYRSRVVISHKGDITL